MDVIVVVKQAAFLSSGFAIESGQIPETDLTYRINPQDRTALAVALEQASTDDTVTVLTVGPERSTRVLNQALAVGADKGIRIWDEQYPVALQFDPTAVAQLLAPVVQAEDPSIVLAGNRSADLGHQAVGPALGAICGYQWITSVTDIAISGDQVRAYRQLEEGLEARMTTTMPAVLAVTWTGASISLPETPPAVSEQITHQSPDQTDDHFEIEDGRLTVGEFTRQHAEPNETIWTGPPQETVPKLIQKLQESEVIDR